MKNNRILAAFVVFLILINCAILGAFWIEASKHQKEEMAQRPSVPVFEYLSKILKLTPAQKSQYEKMRDRHINFADSINNETHLMRDSFFAYLKDPAAKPEVVNDLGKRISVDIGKLDTSTFYHFKRFRAILKPDQQTRFDQVIQDVLRNMGGRPPQGGPGGQQGPPPNNEMPGNDRPHMRWLHGGPPPNGRPGDRLPPPGWPPPDGPPGSRPGGPPPNGGPPPDGPPPGSGPGGPPPNGRPPGGGPPDGNPSK
jgi:hypothetical protein